MQWADMGGGLVWGVQVGLVLGGAAELGSTVSTGGEGCLSRATVYLVHPECLDTAPHSLLTQWTGEQPGCI